MLAGVVAACPAAVHADTTGPVPSHPVCRFAGDRVIESSGLVDEGRLLLTVNDSGDGPYVYAVDRRSGRLVGVTTYSSQDVTDVESMAPRRDGTVWVGDTGDNRESRDQIAVYHLPPVGRGTRTEHATRFALSYPDGAHNAEAILVQPGSGRLFVVTKSVFGGTVYAAPRHLSPSRTNRLAPFARVSGLVTDAAFFPDGKRVLLRTYGTASVYTFPDFALVGTVRLPPQRQGEGVAIGADGEILLSSEGVHAPVLAITLPASLAAASGATGSGRPAASPVGPPPSTRRPSPVAHPHPGDRSAADWAWIAVVGVVLAGLGYGATRLSRFR